MSAIDLGIIDHVLLFLLVAVFPWNARRRFQALTKAVDRGETETRMRAYRTVVIEKWVLAAALAVAWIALSRSAESIGLVPNFTPLAVAGYLFTALAIGALLLLARAAVHSEQGRRRTSESIASVHVFVPRTAHEKRWFDTMSVSASIEEELVYRAFLFAYLAALMPSAPVLVIIVLAGAVFGLGHLYQGVLGVLKTGMVGVVLGVVYWMTGSVWAPILLHLAIDLSSGWITQQIVTGSGLERSEPAAA